MVLYLRGKNPQKEERIMKRITNQEIESTIELFVNCIYDEDYHGYESGWATATLQDWMDAVYNELVTWKDNDGCCYHSHENRFDGKDNIVKRIRPMIIERLNELQKEIVKDEKNITIMAVAQ